MQPIAEFLSHHPPFEGLPEDELKRLVEQIEVEYFAAGEVIFEQGVEPMRHVRMVRSGAVELLDRGRVLDRIEEGEMFGHPAMLSGLPTGLEARAAEDALCYRSEAALVVPLLGQPAGLRYLARSLLSRPKPDAAMLGVGSDPSQQPVARLVRDRPILCAPETSVREAARRMAEAKSSSALIGLGNGDYGIITDHDLRERVIAAGVSTDAPVTAVMSAPAFCVGPERFGAEVMLEMLDRDIRHVPVVSPFGEALGVLTDVDLLAVESRTPFSLRREIDEASSPEQLRHAADRLRPAVLAMHDAGMPPAQISGIIAIVADALARRLIDLTRAGLGPPPAPLSWIALGSLGRREVVPSSDVDSALLWDGEEDEEIQRYMSELGRRVSGELARYGFVADPHGATAARPYFVRSIDGWRRAIREAIERPTENKGLIVLSLILDGRAVAEVGDVHDLPDELRRFDNRRPLRNLLLRLALSHRPPSGFLRDFVVEDSGEHRGQLDIKLGGLLPITDIARYASFAAGTRTTSTIERLRVASTAGTLDGDDARTLAEAFELFWRLRLEHQVEQLRRGAEPDDYLDPQALNALTRRYLRDAFHAVRALQRKLANRLVFG